MEAVVTNFNMQAAAAEIFLLSAICVVLLVDVFLSDSKRWITYALSMLTLAGCAYVTVTYAVDGRVTAFDGSFVADPMGDVLKLFTYGTVAVSLLYSRESLQRNGLFRGEYFILALLAMLGVMVLVSAGSLLTAYLGVELLALALYAMVAFNRDSGVAAESAMKYFVLGAIASGTLLYGFSILYGVTGTLQLDELAIAVREVGPDNLGLIFGLAFVIVGIAFKFGAVPFHMWVPDVYHGAPTAVTLFVGSAPKIASFVLAIRVLAEGLDAMVASWQSMLIAISVASMIIGNVVAIAQTNLKRMLAYSTVSHVGFLLVGFAGGGEVGYSGALFYAISYAIMSAAAFGAIIVLSRQGFEADRIDDFKGLNARNPWQAGLVLCVMASLAGVPPFLGFWAKLVVLGAAVNGGFLWLALVGVLCAVIGAFYYLRVIKVMYFDEPVGELPPPRADRVVPMVFGVNALALLVLGIAWNPIMAWCKLAFAG